MSETVAVRTIGGPHPGIWLMTWPWPPPAELAAEGGRYVLLTRSSMPDQLTDSVVRGASYVWYEKPPEERCRHELLLRDCGECRRRPVAHPAWEQLHERSVAEAGMGPWIESRYSGRCAACSLRWEPGDMIRVSDDEGGWLCSTCGSDSS